MTIYKYGLSGDYKTIYMIECEVLQEKMSVRGNKPMLQLQEKAVKKWIFKEELEVFSNKMLYSENPNKLSYYIDCLKDYYTKKIAYFLENAEKAKVRIREILKVNNAE